MILSEEVNSVTPMKEVAVIFTVRGASYAHVILSSPLWVVISAEQSVVGFCGRISVRIILDPAVNRVWGVISIFNGK